MSSPESIAGVDIGGAHLKFADLTGRTHSVPFPLWQRSDHLAGALAEQLKRFPRARCLAVTMTGELADCFEDAAQGVRHIVAQTEQAVASTASIAQASRYYSLQGSFVSAAAAKRDPDRLAAANWHALASLTASLIDRPSLLIDVGSTTTDLIALQPHRILTESRTDFDRLQSKELVYVGIGRTPLCALTETLLVVDKQVPVMKEWFATSDDCALLTGITAEAPHDGNTADGRPRTQEAARNRMARMVGLDHRHFSLTQARQAAEEILRGMAGRLVEAAEQVAPAAEQWLLAGHGATMLQRWGKTKLPCHPLSARLLDLCQSSLGTTTPAATLQEESLARVAPAFAVASLLSREHERLGS